MSTSSKSLKQPITRDDQHVLRVYSPETRSPAGPDPPWPKGETIPLTYHPVPDIA